MDENRKAKIAEMVKKNHSGNLLVAIAVLLSVLKAGWIDNPGIIKTVIDDYLNPDYVESKCYEIGGGGPAIEKLIRWVICQLCDKGYLNRTQKELFLLKVALDCMDRVKKETYEIREKGKAFLEAAVYCLEKECREQVYREDVLTGKALEDLRSIADDIPVGYSIGEESAVEILKALGV